MPTEKDKITRTKQLLFENTPEISKAIQLAILNIEESDIPIKNRVRDALEDPAIQNLYTRLPEEIKKQFSIENIASIHLEKLYDLSNEKNAEIQKLHEILLIPREFSDPGLAAITPEARKAIINAIGNTDNSDLPLHQRVCNALASAEVAKEYQELSQQQKEKFKASGLADVALAHLDVLYESHQQTPTKSFKNFLLGLAGRTQEQETHDFSNDVNQDLEADLKKLHSSLMEIKDRTKNKTTPTEKQQYQQEHLHFLASNESGLSQSARSTKTLATTMEDFFEKQKRNPSPNARAFKSDLCNHLIRSEKTGILHASFNIADVASNLERNSSKIPKALRESVVQEFKMGAALSSRAEGSALRDKCYIDTKTNTSLTEQEHAALSELEKQSVATKSWENGGWLVDLQEKHPLQWALERNDQIAKENQSSETKKPLLALKTQNQTVEILAQADKIGVECVNKFGKATPVVEWAFQRNLQISNSKDIKAYVNNTPAMAKHRDRVTESLKTPEELDKHIDSILHNPYSANAHEVALDLLTPNSPISNKYSDLLDQESVERLCTASKIKFNGTQPTLSNLLQKAAIEGIVKYTAVKNSIADTLYQKASDLEKKMDEIDNPKPTGIVDRLSQKLQGIDHFQDENLTKYSTARLQKVQNRFKDMISEGKPIPKKYFELNKRINAIVNDREKLKEPIREEQKKYDRMYDLLAVPAISDKTREAERGEKENCRLLTTETSDFHKLYKQHGAKKLAQRFHANKTLDKSFLESTTSNLKLAGASVLVGAGAGVAANVGTKSKIVGAVVGVAAGITTAVVGKKIQKIGDASDALKKGEVDFVVANEEKYKSVCSAEVRREVEKVKAIEGKMAKQAKYNGFVRVGRLVKHKAQSSFSTKMQKLDDQIKESGTQVSNTHKAFESESNKSWIVLADKASNKAADFGEKSYNFVVGGSRTVVGSVVGFFKGLNEAKQKDQERQDELKQAASKNRKPLWIDKVGPTAREEIVSKKIDDHGTPAWAKGIKDEQHKLPSGTNPTFP
jgi:hypothetical protein